MNRTINYLKAIVLIFALSAFQQTYGSFHIVGYVPDWGSNYTNSIQYDKYTHLNYSFVLPHSSGSGALTSLNYPSRLTNMVTLAHAANVKVLIAVGGWTNLNNTGFEVMAADPTKRTTFVVNLLNFVSTYDLDGVDIDWEYPTAGTVATNYALMMHQLSDSLHAKGKILTAAVISKGTTGDAILSEVFDYIDFLNLMAYDAGTPHSTYAEALSSIYYWQDIRGLPKDKTVLGVPFYGKSPNESYASLVARDALAPYKDNVGTVYYNGLQTIKNKMTLALNECGGIMIWEVTQDTNDDETSLLKAIHDLKVLSINGKAPEKDGFTIFPNPTLGDITINYTSVKSENLSISISTILGTEVYNSSYQKIQGDFAEQINIESLPSGIYMIRLQAGDRVIVKRLTVNDR